MATQTPIAIVGMACRLPGASDVGEFWTALRTATEGLTRFDPDRLVAEGADPERVRRPDFVPAMGVLSGSRGFDWSYFGYSRAEAASIDPQQRVFLECASAALDDAAIDPTRFPGWIGVYGGADKVSARTDEDTDELGEMARYIGQERDFLATRVAYKLGLRGPAVTVQTACSTSLTAVHLAAASLRGGECDVALAGGVAVMGQGERGYLYEPGGILSPDGHCRPFDERAAGTVPSEGVGVVVLKRLEDALRDGDRIAGVVLGSAINNDGAGKMGYTAPSVSGQSEVIRHTQQVAGVDPADIDYVEAHGTATRIGDPVEVQALTDVFAASTDATGWCRLGAVKSNLGHTGSAAGVAGLIKTVLMLEHGELVPTLHYDRPNPLQELDTTPFQVGTRTGPWPDRGTRLAAVSSFGVGGTNAHVIVQGPPVGTRPAVRGGGRLLTLSAASSDALDRMRENLARRLEAEPDLTLPEVSRTLAERRSFRHRQAFVADDLGQAAEILKSAPASAEPSQTGRVAFLFPGHGPLSHAAGSAAYRLLPGFRAAFQEINDIARERHGLDLSPVVVDEPGTEGWFSDLVNHHLGLFALGYALGRQLAEWDIRPAAMLGNSIGEYAPATLAGLWSPYDAVDLVYQRAGAMAATAPGRMAAVNAPADEVTRRLDTGGDVAIAVRAPGATVLAGPEAAMDRLLEGGALRGLDVRPLDIRQASHGALMDPAAKLLAEAVASTPSQAPRLRFVSNTTGAWADPEAVRTPDYWAEQLRRPVLLDAGAGTLLGAGCDTFVELGPGTSMLGTLRRHPRWDPGHVTVPLLGRPEDGERGVLRALGALWERGADQVRETLPDLGAPGEEQPKRCSLPPYPFAAEVPESGTPAFVVKPAAKPATARRRPVRSRQSVRAVVEELWCTALGVTSAADPDGFFLLGGESLMAVNLMSRIRERTGISVSVAEFSTEATFGRLVRLAEDARPSDDTHVVTLRRGDTGRPIFLIADSAGGALSYQALADEMDGSRPVQALEPADTRMRASVAALAARHAEAVLRTQPSGPYTLGGWSFGAVLAHETARLLTERGERVDVVVCLDAFVQGWAGVPIGLDPEFLLSHVLLQLGTALGVGTAGRQARRNPALRRLLLAKARVLLPYRPEPVPCRAAVFRVGTDARAARRLRARLSPLYGGGVEVHAVGGDHWSLLAQPHAGELAQKLREVLTTAERAGDVH
jgi:phthiocerol/phenolphthiocerol synthesis type-I polyketide synthase E